jgi:hypothetical protein
LAVASSTEVPPNFITIISALTYLTNKIKRVSCAGRASS